MNRANSISPVLSEPCSVDHFVEAYELAREQGVQTNFVDFLPSRDHVLYRRVAAEVMRVDMEHSWNTGQKMGLPQYQNIVPDVLDDDEVLEQVAFEEYRLRLRAGEDVSAEQYRARYGIDTDRWPREIASADRVEDASDAELMQEALVLADNVQNFPAVGDQFLDFRLQREIGHGAFARVYLAQQGELADRLVVLKVAAGHSLEPQHLARLQHTNIVPIYSIHRKGSVSRQQELTAVCMPYLGASTFADLLDTVHQKSDALATEQNLISTFLNRRDPTHLTSPDETAERTLPATSSSKTLEFLANSGYVDSVVWLMKQVAEGIAHAHQRGIVHRDLKPANILLTDEGLPMVLDFNLSQSVVVNGRTSLLVGGTLPYMAPEHLEAVSSGGKIGNQTDLFSLGVIFYELLTGRRPFPDRKGSFDHVVRDMIADRRAGCPSVQALNRAVPPSIGSIVERCLAPDMKDRYGAADELIEDLSRHLTDLPLSHAADRSIAERSKKWLRRHPRLSSSAGVAAIAVVLLATVVGLWLLRGNHLARLQAEGTFEAFRRQQPSLYTALGVTRTETQMLLDSLNSTRKSLATYGVLDDDEWREQTAYNSLSASSRDELDRRLGELLYLAAMANKKLVKTSIEAGLRETMLDESLQLNRMAIDMFPPATCPRALLLQRADLLQIQGATGLAEKLRQRVAGQSSANVIDQYAEVYKLLDAHDYRVAKPLLTKLRDRNPTDPVPWLLLGDANAVVGLLKESEGCLTTAIALRQESYMGYYHRGRCRMDLGQYEDALADFAQVIKLRPQLTCGPLNRALAHQAMGNYEEAIADLTKALELGATQTRIYFLRSDLRRRVGDTDGAEQDFKTGLARTPTDELSWVARGYARRQRDPEAALSDFRQALTLNPFSSGALRNSVHVLADRLNQPEEALKAVNQLLALNERDVDALASRSVLHARKGDRPAAKSDLQQMLRLSKKPQSFFQAACALSLTSSPENSDAAKGLVLLARAVQLEPRWLARAQTDPDLKNIRQTEAFQKLVTDFRKFTSLTLDLNKRSRPAAAAAVE